MRSVTAAVRRMEREAEKARKQALKEEVAANAAADVEDWENRLDDLMTIHTAQAQGMNWQKILDQPEPRPPQKSSANERKAQNDLAQFRPSLREKLFGNSKKRLADLEHKLSVAPALDEVVFEKAQRKYEADITEWKNDRVLAKRLIAGERDAIQEVVAELKPLQTEGMIGTQVNFEIGDNYIHARPLVHDTEIVPGFRRKQLASGKLSQTKMPVGQRNELYQDYVASVALKVAGDLFQVLPMDEVYVTCEADMLNTATGHQEPTPILSVQFVRPTLEKLNLKSVDPSDCMANFNHRMSFAKTKGFKRIEPLGHQVSET